MEQAQIWNIVNRYLGWQGGTIHQVRQELLPLAPGIKTEDLLMVSGARCFVFIRGNWTPATFFEYESMPLESATSTRRWLKALVKPIGFNEQPLIATHVGKNCHANLPIDN